MEPVRAVGAGRARCTHDFDGVVAGWLAGRWPRPSSPGRCRSAGTVGRTVERVMTARRLDGLVAIRRRDQLPPRPALPDLRRRPPKRDDRLVRARPQQRHVAALRDGERRTGRSADRQGMAATQARWVAAVLDSGSPGRRGRSGYPAAGRGPRTVRAVIRAQTALLTGLPQICDASFTPTRSRSARLRSCDACSSWCGASRRPDVAPHAGLSSAERSTPAGARAVLQACERRSERRPGRG